MDMSQMTQLQGGLPIPLQFIEQSLQNLSSTTTSSLQDRLNNYSPLDDQ